MARKPKRIAARVQLRGPESHASNPRVQGTFTTRTFRPQDIAQEMKLSAQRQRERMRGAGTTTQQAVAELRGETYEGSEQPEYPMDIGTTGDDGEWETLGEEVTADVRDGVFEWRNLSRHRFYQDKRTWRQRLERQREKWEPLIDKLSDAYLLWKYPTAPEEQASPPHRSSNTPDLNSPISQDTPHTAFDFDIDVIDIYTLATTFHIHRQANTIPVAEALVLNGYLPTVPEQPSLAISLKTLELYRRLRLRQPSFSIQAFSKVVGDLYQEPYHRQHRNRFSDAFFIYLSIIRNIEDRVKKALARDTSNWRVLNSCPACTYELEDDPPVIFRRMMAMDGNDSQKRVHHSGRATDRRTFEDNDYWLPNEFVNGFANEVRSRKDTSESSGGVHPGGDPCDGAHDTSPCTERWKAASAESSKRMWSIFDETGIFASACNHGIILWVADMVQSGEQAKYPLAIVSKALDVLSKKLLIGYDIGCTFNATIQSSSLADRFVRLDTRCCVNAFHGYAHNYACQKMHHPNVIKGIGLADLEVMERLFSACNAVAKLTRYATTYNRRLLLTTFFQQWDEDKYANIAVFIHNNVVQALDIIATETVALHDAKESLGIQEGDLERWMEEESEYVSSLGKEPEWNAHSVAYVELLQKLETLRSRSAQAHTNFINIISTDFETGSQTLDDQFYSSQSSDTQKMEAERRFATEHLEDILRQVVEMEVRMGITRWTPSTPGYIATLQYIDERKYRVALDNLERVVVQRLFELQRLNVSETGYKMRQHIARSLKTRCVAIQNAVKVYNAAAASMQPPRPPMDWDRVSQYGFLEEFTLLRECRQDILDMPWSKAAIRVTMKQALRVERAHEEIQRCQIEIRRLHTHILHENQFLEGTVLAMKAEKAILAGVVEAYAIQRCRVNAQLLRRIFQTYALPGFSPNMQPGVRKGAGGEAPLAEYQSLGNDTQLGEGQRSLSPETEGSDMDDEVSGVIDFMCDLSLIQ